MRAVRRLPTGAWVLALAGAHVLLWGLGLAWSRRSPALDSAEQLVWAYAMEGGYWKHPPLPSWIMHWLVGAFGASPALPLIATQACMAIALALTWRLGCEFMSAQRSLIAVGLASLVTYHSAGADAYNHSTVLLPFQAAALLFYLLALRRGRWSHWALAGLFAGLALLVKYIALFPIAAALLYLVLDRKVRTRRNLGGLLLAGAIALAVCAPHLWWLVINDFMPLEYARSVASPLPDRGELLRSLLDFTGMQLARLLPLLIVLGWLLRNGRRGPERPGGGSQPLAEGHAGAAPRLFLWLAGVGPLALLVLYGVVTGTELLPRWGSNGFLLAGLLAADAMRGRTWPAFPVALRTIAMAHLVLCIAVVAVAPPLANALRLRGRTQFPGDALAAMAHATWLEHTGIPLRIVIGEVWLGGNVVAHSAAAVAVLIDGEPERSPWISSTDVQGCGALVLLDPGQPAADVRSIQRYMDTASASGVWSLPWDRLPARPAGGIDTAIRVAWGILPPVAGVPCRL